MNLDWKNAESTQEPLVIDNALSPSGVYLRKDIQAADGKYSYKEVFLPIEYKYDIEDLAQYMQKLISVFKDELKTENAAKLASIESIVTSKGEFRIKTPTYDFIFCLMVLKDLPTGIPEGKIRFFNGELAPAMTQAEVQALYFEVANAVAGLDAKFVGYKVSIEAATNLEELEAIQIVY